MPAGAGDIAAPAPESRKLNPLGITPVMIARRLRIISISRVQKAKFPAGSDFRATNQAANAIAVAISSGMATNRSRYGTMALACQRGSLMAKTRWPHDTRMKSRNTQNDSELVVNPRRIFIAKVCCRACRICSTPMHRLAVGYPGRHNPHVQGPMPISGAELVPSGAQVRGEAGAVPIASIIVPTYQEAATVPLLIRGLDEVRTRHDLDLELLIVDDDSPDGTAAAAHALRAPWVHIIERRAPRSLSGAVLDGFARARSDVLVVMDADLTHPPESVPDLLAAIGNGAMMAIGARYIEGSSMDVRWPLSRRLASTAATLLVRPLVRTNDPLSGFFALRREVLTAAGQIRTQGFKLGLELLVRAAIRNPAQVPIHFADRTRGQSKASMREACRFLWQAAGLYGVSVRRLVGVEKRPLIARVAGQGK